MGLLQLEVLVWILYSVLIRKLHVNNNTTHNNKSMLNACPDRMAVNSSNVC